MNELRALAERWRVPYKAVRPHASLGYRSPAPAAWLTEASQRHGKVESVNHPRLLRRFISFARRAILTFHWYKTSGRPRRFRIMGRRKHSVRGQELASTAPTTSNGQIGRAHV